MTRPYFPALLFGVVLFVTSSFATAQAEDQFELKDGDRVVFIGSEFIEQEIKYNHVEAGLLSHWPDRNITFRNLGWAGDDPSAFARGYFNGSKEGYPRLIEEVKQLQPTVIFLNYGSTASYHKPEEVKVYCENYVKLIKDLTQFTARIYLITPVPQEDSARSAWNNQQLQNFVENKLPEIQQKAGGQIVDIFTPLLTFMKGSETLITTDGLRYTPEGYEIAAKTLLEALKVPTPKESAELTQLLGFIHDKNDLYFHKYRPQNETYIRGFRKHEQGQNAKDINAFDPLIAKVEAQIHAVLTHEPVPAGVGELPPKELTFEALTPEQQKAKFWIAPGLDMEIFASEPMVTNPIHMNFDARGRLWIATSPIYPQIRPGAKPNDEIIILEDTDGDGQADKKIVFADDLLIPTAVLPDEKGGAYVANSTELIHLSDTDGDGKADTRKVVFSGFGTEDTHHILHTFCWGPDGAMYFNQSIYIHSHIETLDGVKVLWGGGTWRYDTHTGDLEVMNVGLINPWGHSFDKWGQSFLTDGAGGEGINYGFPGAAFVTAVNVARIVPGLNPGHPKYCGLETISGTHFTNEWQERMLTCDFRANRIVAFHLTPQDSSYTSRQVADVVSCQDRAFRPVDVKLAPDGAIYVADWHNPIINHGEVDFRDPRRDDRHGRIWRLKMKEQPLAKQPDFVKATAKDEIAMLQAPSMATRIMTKKRLTLDTTLSTSQKMEQVAQWVQKLDVKAPDYERLKLEAVWAMVSLDLNPKSYAAVLELLTAKEPRVRAAGVRCLALFCKLTYSRDLSEYLGSTLASVMMTINDPHPQVRLESLHVLRQLTISQSADLALQALNSPMDSTLDYTLWLTLRETQPYWWSLYKTGRLAFVKNPTQLLFALKATENAELLTPLLEMLAGSSLTPAQTTETFQVISLYGSAAQLRMLFERALQNPGERQMLLELLVKAQQQRKIIPEGDLLSIQKMFDHPLALRLTGMWKLTSLQPELIKVIETPNSNPSLVSGAIEGLRAFGNLAELQKAVNNDKYSLAIRRRALVALVETDLNGHKKLTTEFLSKLTSDQTPEGLLVMDAVLANKQGPQILSVALNGVTLDTNFAMAAVRKASTHGPRGEGLTKALRISGKIPTGITKLTPEQTLALVKQVETQGNAARGEEIYTRKELNCQKCHAIAGGGGQVGPDMLSLGASSPVDYIIQSLIEPSAKIKEGYHSTTVVTTDGKTITGLLIRETDKNILIRDAENREVTIPLDDVLEKANSTTSMMPAELTAKLSQDEFVDLVAFLSSLGKNGPYKAPANRYVRRWLIKDAGAVFSNVSGELPVNDVKGKDVTFEINVSSPGMIRLNVLEPGTVRITRGDQEDNLRADHVQVDLPVGITQFHFNVNPNRKTPLKVEVIDVEGSAGRAEPVNK